MTLGLEPIGWTFARQVAMRGENMIAPEKNDPMPVMQDANLWPVKNRIDIINDLAKQLKEKLKDDVTVRISENGREVDASWNDFHETHAMNGVYNDVTVINRAAVTATDKLMRGLAELYVEISELLQ